MKALLISPLKYSDKGVNEHIETGISFFFAGGREVVKTTQ